MRPTLFALGLFASFSLVAAAWAASVGQPDWPSFRGADRTGVSQETGLLEEWPEGGPPLVWETKGAGRGYASLAVAGDRIYTLGDAPSTAEDQDEYLLAFDRQSGQPLWKLKTGAAWKEGQPNWRSSRSTPTADGDLVFAITPAGEIVCGESATGTERWRKNLKQDFAGKKGDGWGYSESVLIDGDRLICTPGGEYDTMVALDKHDGKLIWKTARPGDRGAGHASIVPSTVGETRVYVQTTASGPLGVRASDGKLLWTYDIEPTTAVIPTPIVRDDLVFFSAGYKRGGALLRQVAGADGEVSIEEIYPLKRDLANKHGGVVLVGDYLYGDQEDQGVLFCAELMTGDVKWKSRLAGRGSAAVAAADDRLYIHSADGLMSLVKATPDAFQLVGSFQVPGSGQRPSWSHPVIVGGKLYLREQDQLLCYDIRAE
jgi:outer membrane protein assembly factor BamB